MQHNGPSASQQNRHTNPAHVHVGLNIPLLSIGLIQGDRWRQTAIDDGRIIIVARAKHSPGVSSVIDFLLNPVPAGQNACHASHSFAAKRKEQKVPPKCAELEIVAQYSLYFFVLFGRTSNPSLIDWHYMTMKCCIEPSLVCSSLQCHRTRVNIWPHRRRNVAMIAFHSKNEGFSNELCPVRK